MQVARAGQQRRSVLEVLGAAGLGLQDVVSVQSRADGDPNVVDAALV